jgi:hypothetical protein
MIISVQDLCLESDQSPMLDVEVADEERKIAYYSRVNKTHARHIGEALIEFSKTNERVYGFKWPSPPNV